MSSQTSETLAPTRSLREKLGSKSRNRRQSLSRSGSPEVVARNDLLPRLSLVQIPIDEIRLPARNARKVVEAHVDEVLHSISHFGYCAPVMLGQDNVLLDGVVRYTAAKQAGLPSLPCIRVEHLSATDQRQLRLALNRLAEKGEWDLEELQVEFAELIDLGDPLVMGFDLDEIDAVLLADDVGTVEQGEVEPRPDAIAVAKVGDVFCLGRHRLICGDSTEPAVIQRLMDGEVSAARLVLTDEPYNVKIKSNVTRGPHREFVMASGEMSDAEFLAFNAAWMGAVLPFLCDGGILGTFIDWRGLSAVQNTAAALPLTLLNLIVWSKTNAGMGSLYRSQHELLPLFKKGTAAVTNNVELGRKGRWRSNVWVYPGASSIGSNARQGLQHHPTVKPTAMLEDALLDLTGRGDLVVDPFLGSGSTLMAAETTGRVCRGVELDPLYVDVIVRRYQKVTGHVVTLSGTGEPFDTLAQRRSHASSSEIIDTGSEEEG